MSEQILLIKNFTINYPGLVTWVIAGLMLILGLILQRLWIKECISEWKLNQLLKNTGLESLHNVTIPDDMDGSIFIEHLILTSKNILLLGVKKYRGLIFAAENIDLWTQVIGNKSYKFNNPLRQLESDALVLNSKTNKSKVDVKVLFINGSEFPKGKPDNIVTVADINEWRGENAGADVSEDLRMDWNRLTELAVNNDSLNVKSVYIDEDNTSGVNVFSLISIITLLFLWLAWRLI